MTTYTVAFTDTQIIATVADGLDIKQAIEIVEDCIGETYNIDDIRIESGLTLTDDLRDTDVLICKAGPQVGWLMAETDDGDETFAYAVRR